MRIAIVNDLGMAVESLRRVLITDSSLFIAWIARDGAEAVEYCAKDTPDLILMDLMMPVLDGVEATKRIRASDKDQKKRVPIIALTANNVFENVKQICYKVGMDRYATKPLNMNELMQYLKELDVIS